MKKKMNRMNVGGTATTTSTSTSNSRPGKFRQKMLERFNEMKSRFPDRPNTTMGGPRGDITDDARDARRAGRFTRRYERFSKMYPDYKPTLSGPVDTREEFKTYKQGLREYLKANPSVKPTRPARSFPPRPTTRPEGGGMTRPSRPGKSSGAGSVRPRPTTPSTATPPASSTGTRRGEYTPDTIYFQSEPIVKLKKPMGLGGMKGGGLARKGVGMALAKGGIVKANGCAQRGKTKGRMV